MDIFVLIFILLILWGIQFRKINTEYIGREITTSIKGIFAIIILFSHGKGYLPPPIPNSLIYNIIIDSLGQLMVVMFLIYSGYGIVESYKRKSTIYSKSFFKKRVLKTLIHFDLAVLLFLILSLSIGHDFPIRNYMLCFTGWLDIGNSNWFVFDIIILYLISYLGFIIVERSHGNLKHFLLIMFIGSLLFTLTMYKLKPLWWSDTIMAYPMGMLWSVYKNKLEEYLGDQQKYILFTLLTFFLFIGLTIAGKIFASIFAMFASAVFGILIILLTMRLHLGNRVLHWLGINAFSIYILQRIPMILASEYGFNVKPVLFMAISISTSILLAWGFTKITDRVDQKLFY